MFIPRTYFKTCDGLYVWSTFEKYILSEQKESMLSRGLKGVKSHMLTHDMSDTEIIANLLGGIKEVRKHPFTLDKSAAMIDLQPNGEDGKLVNDGHENIFYVLANEALFVGSVYRRLAYPGWDVDVWYPDEGGPWHAGDKVFYNTILKV